MSKNILCVITAAVMLISFGGCAVISRQDTLHQTSSAKPFEPVPLAVPAEKNESSQEAEKTGQEGLAVQEEEVFPILAEGDEGYEEMMQMYAAIVPIFRYFVFDGRDRDLGTLEDSDFWFLMSMIGAAAASDEQRDDEGNVILTWDEISDYAETFFARLFYDRGVPDWSTSDIAVSDPRSNVVTLSAIGIDGYDDSLLGFWSEDDGSWTMLIEISRKLIGEASESAQSDGENTSETDESADGGEGDASPDAPKIPVVIKRWTASLEPWQDPSVRIFPFRLASVSPAEVPSAEAE